MQTERQEFEIHPHILWDIIQKQAGTMPKAILEGVMNSVDAGGTRCDVVLDRKSFSIIDDGRGFQDLTEIKNHFRTFGYPHKEGDAKYGRFRMGRGQMFSFGRNKWSTNQFRMIVDLMPQEGVDRIGFDLGIDKEVVPGCRIEVDLYNTLSPSELDAAIRELQDYIKFVPIPVTLNGKVVSVDPAKEKWDYETDTYYVRKRASGTLDVYNQGVLVKKYSTWNYGTAGLVVSKVPLDVNFARNDVQSTCKVFKDVVRYLKGETLKASKSAALNDDQRASLAHRLVAGEITMEDVKDARIVTDVTNSQHKFDLLARLDRFQYNVSIAKRGDPVGEMAHTRKIAFVITPETAERFGAETPEEFVAAVKRIVARDRGYGCTLKAMDYERFLDVISSSHNPLKDSELNAAQKLALKSIRASYDVMMRIGRAYDREHGTSIFSVDGRYHLRKIWAGTSDTADAWTDGRDNIWINREVLRKFREGMRGMIQIAGLTLHEQLHEGPSTGTHEHGVEFYERFHDLSLDTPILGLMAEEMLKTCVKGLRDDNKNVMINFARGEDLIAKGAEVGLGEDLDAPSAEGGVPSPLAARM